MKKKKKVSESCSHCECYREHLKTTTEEMTQAFQRAHAEAEAIGRLSDTP